MKYTYSIYFHNLQQTCRLLKNQTCDLQTRSLFYSIMNFLSTHMNDISVVSQVVINFFLSTYFNNFYSSYLQALHSNTHILYQFVTLNILKKLLQKVYVSVGFVQTHLLFLPEEFQMILISLIQAFNLRPWFVQSLEKVQGGKKLR